MPTDEVLRRLDRLEAYQQIQQLAARYAIGIDARDLDAIANTYVPDVKVGHPINDVGREALKRWFVQGASYWYRSMHHLGTHEIHLDDDDHGHGFVQCAVEQEIGDRWYHVGVLYGDTYERRDGEWLFAHRRPLPVWKYEHSENPLRGIETKEGEFSPRLPQEYPTFAAFWAQFTQEQIDAVTHLPI